MTELGWILAGGVAMTLVALVGSVTLLLDERTLSRIVTPLVALAAGTMFGAAVFHLIPRGAMRMGGGPGSPLWPWVALGFAGFFLLESALRWTHGEHGAHEHQEGTRAFNTLILVGDGLHNFIGGLAVAGAFLQDFRAGVIAWVAAAAHEIPQELGDFGVLVHGGWKPRRALLWNVASASSFLIGALVAYAASRVTDVAFLLPFAAGNFLYIAAADLIPEVRERESVRKSVLHAGCFLAGLGVLYAIRQAVSATT